MTNSIGQVEQILIFLKSLFSAGDMCNIWCYSNGDDLLSCTCKGREKPVLEKAFLHSDGRTRIRELLDSGKTDRPAIIGSSLGLQWAAIFPAERRQNVVFVLGPVFYTSLSDEQIAMKLPSVKEQHLLPVFRAIPTMPYLVFMNYVVGVHNALTGQNLTFDDLYGNNSESGFMDSDPSPRRDRSKIYVSEQELLRMVREGNINYMSALRTSATLSPGVPVQGKDPLRQAKTSLVVLETLISRAAMEGGLSPDVAYPLGDSYLKAVEDSDDISELYSQALAMLHDFVYRVHRTRTGKGYSASIRKCCDFIEVSLDRKICASDLSALCGYSEYYLTEKFRRETGVSLNDYIKTTKIERAKSLLTSTLLTVKEISSRLAFNTPNYFIRIFKDITGLTPTKYRSLSQDSH